MDVVFYCSICEDDHREQVVRFQATKALEGKSDESSTCRCCVWKPTLLAVRGAEFDWLLVGEVRRHLSVSSLLLLIHLLTVLALRREFQVEGRKPALTFRSSLVHACLIHLWLPPSY